jgi:hypothetical protein
MKAEVIEHENNALSKVLNRKKFKKNGRLNQNSWPAGKQ